MAKAFHLADSLRAGESAFLGWLCTPSADVADVIARSGFGAVNVDMQHGWHDATAALNIIHAIVTAGKPAVVRVGVGDWSFASRALDMGAEAIIAPMINTAADAAALVEAVKYPPVGKRSWGPGRAMALGGFADAQAYIDWARTGTLAIAMIETPEAVKNLEAILSVPGIDGIFVGPSDLSLTMSKGTFVDGRSLLIVDTVAHILATTLKYGKIPTMYGVGPAHAKAITAAGYRLVAIGGDQDYLAKGCADLIAAASPDGTGAR
ncbi:MAG: aldolase/citrate lyase family protein [Ancalomicrobiaceae bacterium]|nr:aldolase/citrate lyase family protein [Ancalomicrobiaceae bacterium]